LAETNRELERHDRLIPFEHLDLRLVFIRRVSASSDSLHDFVVYVLARLVLLELATLKSRLAVCPAWSVALYLGNYSLSTNPAGDVERKLEPYASYSSASLGLQVTTRHSYPGAKEIKVGCTAQ